MHLCLWSSLLFLILIYTVSFVVCVFIFICLKVLFDFPFDPLVVKEYVAKFPLICKFFNFYYLLISGFIQLWSEMTLHIISIWFNLFVLTLWSNTWSILENAVHTLKKSMYSAAIRWNVLYMSFRFIWSIGLFKSNVTLLVFWVFS